jgi:hypothetical protein
MKNCVFGVKIELVLKRLKLPQKLGKNTHIFRKKYKR